MIKAKNGIWQFTAQDFDNLITYFGLKPCDVMVSPTFNGVSTINNNEDIMEYDFVEKHSWKQIFHITDHNDKVFIDEKVSWFNRGDTIDLVDILLEPEYWTKLFVKELFNV